MSSSAKFIEQVLKEAAQITVNGQDILLDLQKQASFLSKSGRHCLKIHCLSSPLIYSIVEAKHFRKNEEIFCHVKVLAFDVVLESGQHILVNM